MQRRRLVTVVMATIRSTSNSSHGACSLFGSTSALTKTAWSSLGSQFAVRSGKLAACLSAHSLENAMTSSSVAVTPAARPPAEPLRPWRRAMNRSGNAERRYTAGYQFLVPTISLALLLQLLLLLPDNRALCHPPLRSSSSGGWSSQRARVGWIATAAACCCALVMCNRSVAEEMN